MASFFPESEIAANAIALDEFQCRQIELGNLGPTLPIGIFLEEEIISEFSLIPYLGKHEEKLGYLEDENREHPNRINRILTAFLPCIIESFGDWDLKDLAHQQKISPAKLMGQLYAGDALSLALYIRWRTLGIETLRAKAAEILEESRV